MPPTRSLLLVAVNFDSGDVAMRALEKDISLVNFIDMELWEDRLSSARCDLGLGHAGPPPAERQCRFECMFDAHAASIL